MHPDWSIKQSVNKRADWLTLFALVPYNSQIVLFRDKRISDKGRLTSITIFSVKIRHDGTIRVMYIILQWNNTNKDICLQTRKNGFF